MMMVSNKHCSYLCTFMFDLICVHAWFNPRMWNLVFKLGQIDPNGTNLRLFKISFSTFWLSNPKCTETYHLGANLTQLGQALTSQCNIPTWRVPCETHRRLSGRSCTRWLGCLFGGWKLPEKLEVGKKWVNFIPFIWTNNYGMIIRSRILEFSSFHK